MTKVNVLDREGKAVGEQELNDAIFSAQINVPLMHQASLVYLASLRRGTHATKNRSAVRGGGRKPWKQKGTGRARAGSSRSPIWRGGGVTFGPSPRSYSIKMPKKMRRAALLSALSLRAAEGNIIVFDSLNFETPKTKEMARTLANADVKNALLVLDRGNVNALLSAGNIEKITPVEADGVNTYSVLLRDKLVFTKGALAYLEEVLVNA